MGLEEYFWMMFIAMATKIPSYNVHIMDGVLKIVMKDTPKIHMNGLESHAWYLLFVRLLANVMALIHPRF